jgi:hypothetical protein
MPRTVAPATRTASGRGHPTFVSGRKQSKNNQRNRDRGHLPSAFIWARIDGHTSVSEIRDAVVAEFDVGREQAEADLVDFLQQLEQIGALTRA